MSRPSARATATVLWSATARQMALPVADSPPDRLDVAVVGGGYTGLAAARALAREGASVAVLEAGAIGSGASGMNGGFVLPGYKADPAAMVRRLGAERARALFRDSLAALEFVERLVAEEGIACDWHRPGSVYLAARPAHLRALEAEQRLLAGWGHRTELLGAAEIRNEIGSDGYHGGLVDPVSGALQPADYVRGLAAAAARAGAVLVEGHRVGRLRRVESGFELTAGGAVLRATEVLLATNGYTDRLLPWLARRTVPVGSFIIATAPLPAELAGRLIPRARVLSDTWNLLHYFRLSPDGRLVFGGRAAFRPESLGRSLRLLRRDMTAVFPELAGTAVEYGWGGTLGFTLDRLPHAGRHGGISYALGYGGHGVALASWLGDQVGRALAGGPWPALASVPFRAVPFYDGRPWFLPLAGAYYGLMDRWL